MRQLDFYIKQVDTHGEFKFEVRNLDCVTYSSSFKKSTDKFIREVYKFRKGAPSIHLIAEIEEEKDG